MGYQGISERFHRRYLKQSTRIESPLFPAQRDHLRYRSLGTHMHAMTAFLYGDFMAMLTVRNLPDDVHRALRVRAAQHGHSTEAEVREILALAVKPETRVRLGEALTALGRKIGLTNEDVEVLRQVRDKTPAEPLRFE